MGFMDKAKKLAEQAQQKLDETQKNFNQSKSPESHGEAVKYDEHGRPIRDAPPAGATVPPTAEPAAPAAPAPDPTAPLENAPGADAPADEAPAAPPPRPADDDANASPDPFKPIQ
jgi:hypothetical protein